jgi:3-phosphoshikimate 1-carboxyvinyltransferase
MRSVMSVLTNIFIWARSLNPEVSDEIVVEPWDFIPRRNSPFQIVAPFSPDKSLTHRAVILASMAAGQSQIRNPLEGEDCIATREAFKQLGVKINVTNHNGVASWQVDSPGMDQWRMAANPRIDLGNSGTSARLLTGLFAGVQGVKVTLTGDDSLRSRPMARVVEPLRCMGADIHGPGDGALLPLTITGRPLVARTLHLDVASAQIKSALMLAGASADGQTTITLPGGSRNHTELMLQSLGANLITKKIYDRELVSLVGPWRPKAFSYDVPGDPSSAAFFAALAALHPGVEVRCLRLPINPTRIGFFKALESMGCVVTWKVSRAVDGRLGSLGELIGDVTVSRPMGQKLKGLTVLAADIPALIDEVPILSVIAATADGPSTISGLSELRVKESDRLARLLELLATAGMSATSDGDRLWIKGGERPTGFRFACNDHRMVMSACILASAASSPSRILGAHWIQTSFPLFLPAFQNIKAELLSN